MRIPIGVSNRHIHLSQSDVDKLFGKDYQLTKIKDLSQPEQFACQEVVSIKGPKGQIDGVRVIGPLRKYSQVEVLFADVYKLGVPPMIRLSGKIEGTPGCEVIGPNGSITLNQGVIVAQRHLHITVAEAQAAGLTNDQLISVKTHGERGLVFDNVIVRVSDLSTLDMHVDMEEANAAGLGAGAWGEII